MSSPDPRTCDPHWFLHDYCVAMGIKLTAAEKRATQRNIRRTVVEVYERVFDTRTESQRHNDELLMFFKLARAMKKADFTDFFERAMAKTVDGDEPQHTRERYIRAQCRDMSIDYIDSLSQPL